MEDTKVQALDNLLDENLSPKDKLICMLHTDGWNNSLICKYFAGSTWESTEREIENTINKVRDIIHTYLITQILLTN